MRTIRGFRANVRRFCANVRFSCERSLAERSIARERSFFLRTFEFATRTFGRPNDRVANSDVRASASQSPDTQIGCRWSLVQKALESFPESFRNVGIFKISEILAQNLDSQERVKGATDVQVVSPRPNSTTADPNFALPTLGSIAHGRFRQVQFRGARGGNVCLIFAKKRPKTALKLRAAIRA